MLCIAIKLPLSETEHRKNILERIKKLEAAGALLLYTDMPGLREIEEQLNDYLRYSDGELSENGVDNLLLSSFIVLANETTR